MRREVHLLVCYDISDDRRRDRTARLLESRVDRINKSVFEGRASLHDYQSLAKAMRELARPEDSVHIFSLCKSCRDRTVRIGHALPLHTQDWYIV